MQYSCSVIAVLLSVNICSGINNQYSVQTDDVVGYYSWNWGKGCRIRNASLGIAFTGLIDVETAVEGYTPGAAWCCLALVGDKYLSLGGGNAAGIFTAETLKKLSRH